MLQSIGLDLGTKLSHLTVLTPEGEVMEEAVIRTTRVQIRRWLSVQPRSSVCLEVGSVSPWVSRLLTELGHEVIACNPRRLKIIAESTLKTDRLDAETLARLGRLGQMDPTLLARVQHRSEETQLGRSLLRVRRCLMRSRVHCVTTARGLARSLGHPLPACKPETFGARVRGRPRAAEPWAYVKR